MSRQLDGDALDTYLQRLEQGYQDESDRLQSEQSSQNAVGIHRMRGAANAASAIRKQLKQFEIPQPPARRPRAPVQKEPTT